MPRRRRKIPPRMVQRGRDVVVVVEGVGPAVIVEPKRRRGRQQP